ncbi:hypothetical protein LLEC1_01688 [Akanthomyces lecanii]|uniref:FAD-binding domain-containing protein n=1 Tax=Cordyceps confragosa TaxID=2714763 RepID=A0A179I1V2_CORDF|nr:hypothetical protein LLEC1_01688 [Akanthomyces lecanii]
MTAESKPKPHVLIAGAGLSGLALAQVLRKQGISYKIFERSVASRTQGYAIGIHSIIPELVAAFPDDMPSPAVTDHLLPLNLPAEIAFYDGQSLESRFGVRAASRQDIIRANRQRLRDWLATNIDIEYHKVVETVDEDEDAVTVHFADGTSACGDFLVGADGCFSKVRHSIFSRLGKPDPLNPLPLVLLLGEVTLHGADFERQLELANSCYVSGYQSEGSLFVGLNSVTPDGTSGDYYWCIVYNDEAAKTRPHWTASADKELLYKFALSKVETMDPRFLEVVKKTDPCGMVVPSFTLQDLEIDELPVSRVTLLGDAAHSMTPFRGEGGIHAMRDSLSLARTITKVAKEGTGLEGWKRGVDEYQKEMLERGVKAVRLSRTAGNDRATTREGPRYAWNRPVGPLPTRTGLSLENVPHIDVEQLTKG